MRAALKRWIERNIVGDFPYAAEDNLSRLDILDARGDRVQAI